MSKLMKLVIVAVAVIVVAGGAILFQQMRKKDTTSSSSNSQSASGSDSSSSSDTSGTSSDQTSEASAALTITYDGSSFSLSASTIKVGETVKVVNSSSEELDFDSDPHPVHTDNTELNVGDIAPGESATFLVHKTGTWGFHNHLNASQHGSFTVVE